MGKRKPADSEEEDSYEDEDDVSKNSEEEEEEDQLDEEQEESSEEEAPIKKPKSKEKHAKKPEPRTIKKPRLSKGSEDSGSSSVLQKGADGRKFLDLGKKRRAQLSDFKGTMYLDIREYYETNGELRPGKKGISITQEQWNLLKDNASTIDSLFNKAAKKR
ncbi:hypothetical protein EIP91_011681 [Steccherinum ochraceum]|uniref:Transcriptional coactivator p15 (PC4) C-terminal domain-containing protein n=1 Tax=Steccherinum ochraceum TaxID=92696 RepID=A0A4R0RUH8_9APHY|nr:hypothetical protein EIP91_011681 [Steccherinum ochraceum]